MARKRIGKRADEPRLDDASNWVTLTMVHRVLSEQLIGAQGSVWATLKLTEWLQSGELRFKRKSMADPKRRQLGRAAFWRGRQIYFEDGSVGSIRRIKRGLAIKRPASPGAILSGNRTSIGCCRRGKPPKRVTPGTPQAPAAIAVA